MFLPYYHFINVIRNDYDRYNREENPKKASLQDLLTHLEISGGRMSETLFFQIGNSIEFY